MAGPDEQPDPHAHRKRVEIKVPDTYRGVRDEVWEELEKFLFTGFLTAQTYLVGRTFVFKTLNHLELRNLEFLRPMRSAPAEVTAAFKAAFIAHSIFMIDGENVLHDRPRHIRRLQSVVAKMSPGVQDEILINLRAINTRSTRLHPLVEAYVHENRSRYRWLQVLGTTVHSPQTTGIPGSDVIGMNWCQLTWTALNRILDRREEMDREWMNAKFVGSCMNPKGVKSVDERDRGRKERDRIETEDLKMKVLKDYLNRTVGADGRDEKLQQLPDGRLAVVDSNHRAESVEELARQLQNALNGEKDHHDLMMDRWKKGMEERNAAIARERRSITHGISRRAVDSLPSIDGGGSRIIGSEAAAKALIAEGRERMIQSIIKSQSPPDLQGSDKGPGDRS